MEKIKVLLCGASGRMGQEVVKAVSSQEDMEFVSAVDVVRAGEDAGSVAGIKPLGINISNDLKKALKESSPHVLVDFTKGDSAPSNILSALESGAACVVGTTGISPEDTEMIKKESKSRKLPVLIAPNFSLGAVLMMIFSRTASKFYSHSEIIELHHDKKNDAPSGTALRTANLMHETREKFVDAGGSEKLPSVRGGEVDGIRIHSVRLPGFVAHQEVIFGGESEILSIRHDSMNRTSFMPGVLMAVRKIRNFNSFIAGLENIMEM